MTCAQEEGYIPPFVQLVSYLYATLVLEESSMLTASASSQRRFPASVST